MEKKVYRKGIIRKIDYIGKRTIRGSDYMGKRLYKELIIWGRNDMGEGTREKE